MLALVVYNAVCGAFAGMYSRHSPPYKHYKNFWYYDMLKGICRTEAWSKKLSLSSEGNSQSVGL